MTFLRIEGEHTYLTIIRAWYEISFPSDERRNFDELLELLSRPDMHLCALVDQEQLVGFMIYWQWPDVIFVEHFVIDPRQRGKQFGQQALAHLLRIKSPYFILEVELARDEISQRRIPFYERQGFSLNPFAYAQPPYQRGKPAIPMHLMSMPAIASQETFNTFTERIKEQVYERFYK